MSVKLSSYTPKFHLGYYEVSRMYIGSYLVYEKDAGGGEGGGDTVIITITSVSVSDIPAGGGSVNSCVVYYTYDGESRHKTVYFTAVSGEDLDTDTTGRTEIAKRTITVEDSGSSKSKEISIYQEANYITGYTNKVLQSWSAGWIDGAGNSVDSVSAPPEGGWLTNYVCVKGRYRATANYKSGGQELKYIDEKITPEITISGCFTEISPSQNNYGSSFGYAVYAQKNTTGQVFGGSVVCRFNGETKTASAMQGIPAEEMTAMDYLVLTLERPSGAPSGVYTVNVENTSDRDIKMACSYGNTASNITSHEVVISANGKWGIGGYWGGITSAEFV